MEQTDQLQLESAQAPAAPAGVSVAPRVHLRDNSLLNLLWRYRAFIAGIVSLALAVAGEIILRSPQSSPSQPPAAASNPILIGDILIGVAALLVGLVAWVNDGPRADRPRPQGAVAATGAAAPVRALATRSHATSATSPSTRRAPQGLAANLRNLALRYSVLRTSLGWYGTIVGLVVAVGLAIWMALVLRRSWTDPLAGWIWLAIMLVLLLTFVGVKPWPKGTGLLPHDPAEPAFEPPVLRAEWIALAVIMVGAALLRLWSLGTIPAGPYIDEAGRAIDARNLNYGLPVNRETFIFFGTGWWGVPSFYFWMVAQSMKVFGDNLLGARVIHALAGIATVWYTYRIGRVVWSPRAGLIAGALVTVSDLAIQASRTAGESTITLFFWTACFYYLYKALKLRQPLDFVLSGLAGGFVLLGYASGKLLPLFLALAALYLLLRWGFMGIRRYLPGLVLMALAAAAVSGPNLIYQFTQNPTAMTERYNSVTIFTPLQQANLATQYGTDNWPLIIGHQFVTSYSAYDVGQEAGPFYPTGQPVLPVLWAALWVLGTAYMVWRLGDARYAILAIWMLGALAGSALTTDDPTLQRALMVVPLLALIPALFLDRLAGSLLPLPQRAMTNYKLRIAGRIRNASLVIRNSRRAVAVVLAALVIFSAFQTLTFYFGPYTAEAHYLEFALAGDYMSKLDPQRDIVYDYGLPVMFGDPSPLVFLSNGVTRKDLGNQSDVLPVTDTEGKDVHFLIAPPDNPMLGIVKSYYPQGTLTTLSKPDGTPIVAAYHVTDAQLDAQRMMSARYTMPDNTLFERQEARLGTYSSSVDASVSPPPGLVYPTTAEWLGGLVSPAYGAYRMEIDAPAGGTLDIDGEQVLTATAGTTPTEGRVIMAKGVHTITLRGMLDSAGAKVQLLWGTDNGQLVPVGREFFWAGAMGGLTGEVYTGVDPTTWMVSPQLPAAQKSPTMVRNDGLFSWTNITYSFASGPDPFIVWRGKLLAPADGTYGFEAVTPGAVTIWIDGLLEGVSNVPGTPNKWPVNAQLAAGDHQFEMRFYATQANIPFQLFWSPPNGPRVLLMAAALESPDGEGGAQIALPGAPVGSPDSSLINASVHEDVRVTATLPGEGWGQVLGIAVLPDGSYAVGDSGNHKLLVYGSDGKVRATWGGAPQGDDTFNDVSDLASTADGHIVALDAENADIRIFDETGKQITRIPAGNLGVTHARGITVGPDGKFYIADTAGSRVVRVSQTGDIEMVYAEGNGSINKLDQPTDVAVTPDGTVYVVDLQGRVVRFDTNGQAQREWDLPIGRQRGGSKLAVWGGKMIAITNSDKNGIEILNPDDNVVMQLTPVAGQSLSLSLPVGIAVGPDNKLYVVDSGGERVVVLQAED